MQLVGEAEAWRVRSQALLMVEMLEAVWIFTLEILAKAEARLKNISGNSASPSRKNPAFGRKNSAEADPDWGENSALLQKKIGTGHPIALVRSIST